MNKDVAYSWFENVMWQLEKCVDTQASEDGKTLRHTASIRCKATSLLKNMFKENPSHSDDQHLPRHACCLSWLALPSLSWSLCSIFLPIKANNIANASIWASISCSVLFFFFFLYRLHVFLSSKVMFCVCLLDTAEVKNQAGLWLESVALLKHTVSSRVDLLEHSNNVFSNYISYK